MNWWLQFRHRKSLGGSVLDFVDMGCFLLYVVKGDECAGPVADCSVVAGVSYGHYDVSEFALGDFVGVSEAVGCFYYFIAFVFRIHDTHTSLSPHIFISSRI